MKIFKYLVSKPIAISLIIITLSLLGLLSYFKLPIADLPTIDYPVVTVSAFYPGANPQVMADAVATALEQQLVTIQGLNNMVSISTDSFTRIILTFGMDLPLDTVIPDIQNAISYAQGYMPKLPDNPNFSKSNPSQKPVMFYMASSETIPHDMLFQFVNKKITEPLNMTQGVSSITIWSVSSAIRIYLDPQKMAAFGLALSDVSYALMSSSALSSGGFLSNNSRTLSIIPEGQLTTPQEYNNIILKYENNNPIRISDIGIAQYTPQQINYKLDYFDNRISKYFNNAALFSVSRKDGSNTLKLTDEIRAKAKKFASEMPNSFKLELVYDRSASILKSINEMKFTLIAAIIFVIAIIYLFLGMLRATLIPAAVIIVSLLCSFAFMYLMDFSIDSISILALILSVGFIVDDSIVVIENSSRHIEKGLNPLEASLKSLFEIKNSIIAMSLSLAVVFIPILFIQGISGKLFREFSMIGIIIVIISGLLSLTFSPMMCANTLPAKENLSKARLRRLINIFMRKIIKYYSLILVKFIKKPAMSFALLLICIIAAFLFYFIIPKNFIPEGDSGTIFGSIEVPIGVSAERMQDFQNAVDGVLSKDQNIARFFTTTGLYLGADQSTGMITIILKDASERATMGKVLAGLRKKFEDMPFNLGRVYLAPMPVLNINTGGETTANGALYSYLITGPDRDKVYKYGKLFEDNLRNIQGFKDVQSDIKLNMPQLNIKILRDKAYSLGINTTDIENALLSAYSQGRVAQYLENSFFYDVAIELEDKYRGKPEDLSQIYLRSSTTSSMVPLSDVVEVTQTTGPRSVTRYQQLAAATISFNLASGFPVGSAVNELNNLSKKILPDGVYGELQGRAHEFMLSIKSLAILIIIAVFLIYVILGLLYESYVYPLAILTTIPVALAGALGSILLFRSELSLFAYVGLFMLLGIIVKNGIILVDMAQQKMRYENKTPSEAIYSASLIRFRPILMTGLTAVFGAVPLLATFNSDVSLMRPIGLVIIGGIILSQILTLFIIPGIFLYLHRFQTAILDKYSMTRSK